jgi:hypothetical protein
MSHLLCAGLGMDVTWKPYKGLGRWYRVENEIEDILGFLWDPVDLPENPMPPPPNDQHECKPLVSLQLDTPGNKASITICLIFHETMFNVL